MRQLTANIQIRNVIERTAFLREDQATNGFVSEKASANGTTESSNRNEVMVQNEARDMWRRGLKHVQYRIIIRYRYF